MPSASVSAGLEGSVLLCVGLIAAFSLLWTSADVWKAHQSRSWAKVEGKIVSAQARKFSSKIGFCLDIEYSYQFKGGNLSGTTRTFGDPLCGSENHVKEVTKTYVPGAAVDVYVNPVNSFESVLLPGEVKRKTWFGVGISVFLATLGLLGGIAVLRRS